MSVRLFEALRSAFAALGILFFATIIFGGVSVVEPHAGWSSFFSGALWVGVPVAIGLNRYRRPA